MQIIPRRPRVPAPPDDPKRVCYLLLYLGAPAPERRTRLAGGTMYVTSVFGDQSHVQRWRLPAERLAARSLGFTIWTTRLCSLTGGCNARYMYRFPWYLRDDARAVRIAESLLHSISLLYGPVLGEYDVTPVFRVPAEQARNRAELSLEAMVRLEEVRRPDERITGAPRMTIGPATFVPRDVVDAAWHATPVVFKNEELFRAVAFLKASQDDFWVAPGQIDEVAGNTELSAVTVADRCRMENALQNAYKAIEAVIGDPPSNARRFWRRLREIGVDPLEPVGYAREQPIHELIREMNKARDKMAAHGSTARGTMSASAVLEYTACAQFIVWTAVESKLGHPLL